MPQDISQQTAPLTPTTKEKLTLELSRSLEIMISEIETEKWERAMTSLLHIKSLLEKFIALDSGIEITRVPSP